MISTIGLVLLAGAPAGHRVDTTLARRAMHEAAFYAQRDSGSLWGIPLSTPLLIVDPSSRRAISSVPDSAGLMSWAGNFYEARLPDDVAIANTSVAWGRRTWAMVLSPLPTDSVERGILLMHEVWHSVQARTGVPAGDARQSAHRDGFGADVAQGGSTRAGGRTGSAGVSPPPGDDGCARGADRAPCRGTRQ